ncbi:hypothetical protein ABPG74_011696 [Tetrahymena malaccensis]
MHFIDEERLFNIILLTYANVTSEITKQQQLSTFKYSIRLQNKDYYDASLMFQNLIQIRDQLCKLSVHINSYCVFIKLLKLQTVNQFTSKSLLQEQLTQNFNSFSIDECNNLFKSLNFT